jgi:two-component system response regulator GlrR
MVSERETETLGRHRAFLRRFRLGVVQGPDTGQMRQSEGPRVVVGTHPSADLILTDTTASRFHFEIALRDGVPVLRDLGSRNGTTIDGVPVIEAPLAPGQRIGLGRSALRFELADDHVEVLLAEREQFGRLRGQTPAARALFALLERVAPSDATILLEGETGTGKDTAALSIHEASPRAAGPFLVVDCGAIAPTLLESELFGHLAGAFTGADRERVGVFQAASGGTVFLDEIGELPPALQRSVLRVIERREVKPLGAGRYQEVDVRILAATNADLRAEVNARRFRADLYYRLAVVPVTIPPLRERLDDLPILIDALLEELGRAGDPAAAALRSADFLAGLRERPWPGNVRELRNHLERALAGVVIADEARPAGELVSYRAARARWEHDYLAELLARAGKNLSQAAKEAGMDRATLYRLLWRHGLR